MRVVLDSNIIIRDGYHFRSATMRAVVDAAQQIGLEILVPEVVYEKVHNSYNVALQERLDKYHQAIEDLDRILEEPVRRPELFDLLPHSAHDYRTSLGNHIRHAPFRKVYLPDVDHRETVRRAIRKKKPFAEKKDGYRDYLIWLTILDELKRTPDDLPLYFISENKHDFAADLKASQIELHSDLVADLQTGGWSKDAVVYLTSLADFRNQVINPHFESMESLSQLVLAREFSNPELYELIPQAINGWFRDKLPSVDISKLGLPLGADYIDMAEVVSVDEYNHATVRSYSLNELVIDLQVTATCSLWVEADSDTPMGYEIDENRALDGYSSAYGEVIRELDFIITTIVGAEPERKIVRMDAILISRPTASEWWQNY